VEHRRQRGHRAVDGGARDTRGALRVDQAPDAIVVDLVEVHAAQVRGEPAQAILQPLEILQVLSVSNECGRSRVPGTEIKGRPATTFSRYAV
jgi:hypothetical protein